MKATRTFTQVLPKRRTGIAPATAAGASAAVAPGAGAPAWLQQAYDLTYSQTDGVGATVGIVDAYDDPTAESDLAVYRSRYGLPPCTTANGCFRKLNQNGRASIDRRQRHDGERHLGLPGPRSRASPRWAGRRWR